MDLSAKSNTNPKSFKGKYAAYCNSKLRSTILAAALIVFLALTVTSCAAKPADSSSLTDNTTRSDVSPDPDPADDGYYFEYNSVKIIMHGQAAEVLQKLGKESSYFEAESCAFQGLDKTYSYPGFDLMAYPIKDTDYISSVVLMDDSVTTVEGLYIGAPESDITAKLGEEYDSKNGSYVYTKGLSQLMIIAENGAVTSIEYTALVD